MASEALLEEAFFLLNVAEFSTFFGPKISPFDRWCELSCSLASEAPLEKGFFLPRVAEVLSALFEA